jgi:hypothetical protein
MHLSPNGLCLDLGLSRHHIHIYCLRLPLPPQMVQKSTMRASAMRHHFGILVLHGIEMFNIFVQGLFHGKIIIIESPSRAGFMNLFYFETMAIAAVNFLAIVVEDSQLETKNAVP